MSLLIELTSTKFAHEGILNMHTNLSIYGMQLQPLLLSEPDGFNRFMSASLSKL